MMRIKIRRGEWYKVYASAAKIDSRLPIFLVFSANAYIEVSALQKLWGSRPEYKATAWKLRGRQRAQSKLDLIRRLLEQSTSVVGAVRDKKREQEEIKTSLQEELEGLWISVRREATRQDPIAQRCRLIQFCSRSSGRRIIPEQRFHPGTQIKLKRLPNHHILVQRKRRMREVEFLMVKNGNGNVACYPIVRGEIRNPKRARIDIDALAQEILSSLEPEQRTADHLLALAKENERIRTETKK